MPVGDRTDRNRLEGERGTVVVVARVALAATVSITLVFVTILHLRGETKGDYPLAPSVPLVLSQSLLAVQMLACVSGWITRKTFSGKIAFLVSFPLMMVNAQLSRPPGAPLLDVPVQLTQPKTNTVVGSATQRVPLLLRSK